MTAIIAKIVVTKPTLTLHYGKFGSIQPTLNKCKTTPY